MNIILSNGTLEVTIDSAGAEVHSICDLATNHQYIWHGDKCWWGRHSPVLFPIVGSVWQGRYRMDGTTYELRQHGFARDSEFDILPGGSDTEVWFVLRSSEATLSVYPRDFELRIGYCLDGRSLRVMWSVTNTGHQAMSFQIGAHPAFNYPAFDPEAPVHGYLRFDADEPLESQLIAARGCVGSDTMRVATDTGGLLPLTATTFDINTIILAGNQVHRVDLLDTARQPYVSVRFGAPVVGIWSPRPDCPFVCIEPWWGRADRVGYEGEFADREWVNTLAPGTTFDASYTMTFERV